MRKMKTLFTAVEDYLYIQQSSKRFFTVTYGKQIKDFTNWESAFKNFGECLAHYLECESILSR